MSESYRFKIDLGTSAPGQELDELGEITALLGDDVSFKNPILRVDRHPDDDFLSICRGLRGILGDRFRGSVSSSNITSIPSRNTGRAHRSEKRKD
jgi:hypothetical protein